MKIGRCRFELGLLVVIAVVLLVASVGILAASRSGAGSESQSSPLATSSTTGSVVVGSASDEQAISSAFWGINIAAAQRFNAVDAASVAATPVNYLLFPSGNLGEELNYTSGVLTKPNGAHSSVDTSAQDFVTSCKLIGCKAIMQLPAEIDDPATAAYFASYVVHTLKFQPAYWQIGNDPSGWTHFGVPWSEWKGGRGGNATPLAFANLVHAYIAAVTPVDPSGQFLALGAGMGGPDYDKPWVEELAKVDGKELTGISVHSYVLGTSPSKPTDAELFANLNGPYSLPDQLTADRSYIQAACSACTQLKVFVTEINAAEDDSYSTLLSSFAGTLYLAAETIQGLTLHATNLDWFAYDSDYPGAWSEHPLRWQMQYYLFSDVLTQLKGDTLPTTVTGPATFFAIATCDSSGLALLLVNVNTATAVDISASQAGFVLDHPGVTEYSWSDGASRPSASSVSLSNTVKVPPESIVLLKVAPAGEKLPHSSATSGTPAPLDIPEKIMPGVGADAIESSASSSDPVRSGSAAETVAVSRDS